MQQPPPGPNVFRRQLGKRLKHLREKIGFVVDDMARDERLGLSRDKIYRLEGGKHPAKVPDVRTLCALYGATDAETETLIDLAVATNSCTWWREYGADAVDQKSSLYIDVEPIAAAISTYEAEFVPGLLQTTAYARRATRNPDGTPADLVRRAEVRMRRQAILDRDDPPRLHAVLNEAVLLREVGGADALAEQRRKLVDVAERHEHVTIEVLPFSAGAHAAMEGSFVIMDFPDPEDDPPFVYQQSANTAVYKSDSVDVDRYRTIFQQITSQTIPIQEYQP